MIKIVVIVDHFAIDYDNNGFKPIENYENKHLTFLFKVLYTFMKVCGVKSVIKLLTHRPELVEPVFYLLLSQNKKKYELWEVRYCLLSWMTILVLEPFDIESIDTTSGDSIKKVKL